MLEGPDLINAALDAGAGIEALFVDADHRDAPVVTEVLARVSASGVRVFTLDAATFAQLVRDWTEKHSQFVPNWEI